MGKGKGKLDGWSSEVPAGLYILELKNLRYGRAMYYARQIIYKLSPKAKIISKNPRLTPLVLNPSIFIKYDVFW
jgi:ribosomal protein L16/L10AE